MNRLFIAFTIAAGLAAPALADGAHHRDRTAVAGQMSAQDMTQKIDALGYDVQRLKSDDGTFKVRMRDRESGGTVKARFDLTSGELVRAALDH